MANKELRMQGLIEPSRILGIHSYVERPYDKDREGYIADPDERKVFSSMLDTYVKDSVIRSTLKSPLNKDGSVMGVPPEMRLGSQPIPGIDTPAIKEDKYFQPPTVETDEGGERVEAQF
jgi:hypothetical protein